jgi:hypothetical protein
MAGSGAEGGYTGHAGEGIPPAFTIGNFRASYHPKLQFQPQGHRGFSFPATAGYSDTTSRPTNPSEAAVNYESYSRLDVFWQLLIKLLGCAVAAFAFIYSTATPVTVIPGGYCCVSVMTSTTDLADSVDRACPITIPICLMTAPTRSPIPFCSRCSTISPCLRKRRNPCHRQTTSTCQIWVGHRRLLCRLDSNTAQGNTTHPQVIPNLHTSIKLI